MKYIGIKIIAIIYCLLQLSQLANAQSKSKRDGIIGEYKVTVDSETLKTVFQASVFYVNESSFTVLRNGDKQNTTYNLADIKEITYNEVKPGSQSGLWIGAILGAVLGGVASANMITEDTRIEGNYEITETKIPLWPIYGGSLLGGLLGNAITGPSKVPKVIYTKEAGFSE